MDGENSRLLRGIPRQQTHPEERAYYSEEREPCADFHQAFYLSFVWGHGHLPK